MQINSINSFNYQLNKGYKFYLPIICVICDAGVKTAVAALPRGLGYTKAPTDAPNFAKHFLHEKLHLSHWTSRQRLTALFKIPIVTVPWASLF